MRERVMDERNLRHRPRGQEQRDIGRPRQDLPDRSPAPRVFAPCGGEGEDPRILQIHPRLVEGCQGPERRRPQVGPRGVAMPLLAAPRSTLSRSPAGMRDDHWLRGAASASRPRAKASAGKILNRALGGWIRPEREGRGQAIHIRAASPLIGIETGGGSVVEGLGERGARHRPAPGPPSGQHPRRPAQGGDLKGWRPTHAPRTDHTRATVHPSRGPGAGARQISQTPVAGRTTRRSGCHGQFESPSWPRRGDCAPSGPISAARQPRDVPRARISPRWPAAACRLQDGPMRTSLSCNPVLARARPRAQAREFARSARVSVGRDVRARVAAASSAVALGHSPRSGNCSWAVFHTARTVLGSKRGHLRAAGEP